ncbi:MAG: hypothetical protein PGN24_03775 [Microbacterium arborescens]
MPFTDESARPARIRSFVHTPGRRRSARGAAVPLIAACAALLLAGCTPGASYADLDGDLEPADALPESVREAAMDRITAGSQRFVGDHAGTSLWLARGIEPREVCLITYADGSDWALGCGGGSEMRVSGPAGTFAVVSDGAPHPDGFEAISENVSTPAGG